MCQTNPDFTFKAATPQQKAVLAALSNYLAAPNPETLVALQQNALDLLPGAFGNFATAPAARRAWRLVSGVAGMADLVPFTEIRLVIDQHLTDDEVSRAAGNLGYALREILAGEELSDPIVLRYGDEAQEPVSRVPTLVGGECGQVWHLDSPFTVLCFTWNSQSSIRTEPDYHWAFEVAASYIQRGSPVRQTDRAGVGTRGTRLVEGIGEKAGNVSFYVR
jgi:hypothetical protein